MNNKTTTSEVFDIINIPDSGFDTCGKCGVRLKTGNMEQKVRDKMSAEIEKNILNPIALLAGLLANVNEKDDNEANTITIGYLLGLVINGARKELEIQKIGGMGAYILQQWLDEK